MITLRFDDDTEYSANFTINGFSNTDLENIRTLSNITGQLNVDGYVKYGTQNLSPTFPKVSQMSDAKRLRYQCALFGKISASCDEKIKSIKAKNKMDMIDKCALKKYWTIRKLCTFANKNLKKKLKHQEAEAE